MKIKLDKNIPQSFSTMEGKVKVTARYKDQPQTCFECGLPGHEKKDCQGNQSYAKKFTGTPPQPKPEQAMTGNTNEQRLKITDKPLCVL